MTGRKTLELMDARYVNQVRRRTWARHYEFQELVHNPAEENACRTDNSFGAKSMAEIITRPATSHKRPRNPAVSQDRYPAHQSREARQLD